MKDELFQCACLFTISPYEYPKGCVRIFIQKELIKNQHQFKNQFMTFVYLNLHSSILVSIIWFFSLCIHAYML